MSDITTAIRGVLADSRDQARVMERAATHESAPAGAGGGTVTSVALTMPSIFSVTGTPVTLSGTLAATLATQAANLVFAGPTSGGAATPTFRALVAADIAGLAGTGTVTSVALSMPAIFSVSGSPVTTTGTLTATLATQTANYIWAGPTSGGAAAPTFRAMVTADIPNAIVTYAKIQNVATARLLGRSTAGAGVVEEISIGAGLSLSAGTLSSTATGTVTSVALSLPAIFSVSGSPITLSGTLAATLATQAANFGFFGPTSGSALAPTFRALVVADLPQRVVVTRSLNGAVGQYTQIGTWTAATGAHNLRVSVTVDTAGVTTIAKTFVVCCKYAQTAGAWQIVPALADSGLYSSDFQLIANQSGAAVELRLYSFNGGGGGTNTYTVDMENVGFSTDTYAALSGASTMTAPTATLASATDYHAIRGGVMLVKTIPTTVGNYVEIAQFVNGLGGNPFRISISNSDSGFSNSKQYVIASAYGLTSGWNIVQPISDAKYDAAQDYALVINQGGGTTYLRLLRTAGTSAGTAYVQIQWDGAYAGAYAEMTGTGSMSVPTIYNYSTLLAQIGDRAGGTPTGTVDVADAANFKFGATTGTKLGTATSQKVAFHNSTPVIQRAGAAQAAVATTGATNSSPYGYTTSSQADAIVTLVNEIRAALVEKGLIKGSA